MGGVRSLLLMSLALSLLVLGGAARAQEVGETAPPVLAPPVLVAPPRPPLSLSGVVQGESRVVELWSEGLLDYLLVAVRAGEAVAIEPCVGERVCALQVDRAFLREWLRGEDVDVLLWPRSLALADGDRLPALVTQAGEPFDPREWSVGLLPVEFAHPLLGATELNVAASRSHVPLTVPEAVAGVSCRRGRCVRRAEGIDVYAVDPGALSVSLKLEFSPRCRRSEGGRVLTEESLELPVVRCAIRPLAPVPLLAGTDGHRYLLAVGSDCVGAELESLEVETRPPTQASVRGELMVGEGGWRVLEILFESVPVGVRSLELRLVQDGLQRTRLGAVTVPVEESFRATAVRFDMEDLGGVDFIPINRPVGARIAFEQARWARDIVVESRRGHYHARREGGALQLRAEQGAAGSVPLRFAYRPVAVTEALGREYTLARFDSAASYSLRSMNLPISLAGADGFVRVLCRREGEDVEVPPGRTVGIPYEERDSCRLVLNRAAIPEQAGIQRIRITAGGKEQILAVAPGREAMTIALPVGDKKEFDRLVVAVAHEYGGGHYDLSPQHNIGPEARYRVVLGDRRVRISVGSAVPTGLFRFGVEGERGSVPLSAGATARLSFLYKEGTEFPIGFEFGVLGTGLSDTPHLSFVAGIGLSIPVLNADTPLQTSFNIHAWAEYSPTRSRDDEGPWAFLFGPSFSVGKFSTTL